MSLIIEGVQLKFEEPTAFQVNKLMRNSIGKFMALLKENLELIVVNFDEVSSKISLQDAIHVMAYYRATTWRDVPIYEYNKEVVNPSAIIKEEYNIVKKFVNIKGKTFSNKILLNNAIRAEEMVLSIGGNEFDKFSEYIISASCVDGVEVGYQILSSVKSNPDELGALFELENNISSYSAITLLLNNDNNRPISLLTQTEPYKEFPFQPSLLLSI